MNATPKHPDASGNVVISNKSIEIEATGLKPNSVYTIWFVHTKPQKTLSGAGQPPFTFKIDSDGNSSYSAALSESPTANGRCIGRK